MKMMRYVGFDAPGGPEVLKIAEMPAPQPGPADVLIAVEAAGVTHADVMQRQGNYPPPSGASTILGLEVAGTVAAVGERVTLWRSGDLVCALTNGGGYAQYVAVPQGQVLPVPEGWSTIEAASLPENAFTVYDNLFTRARLRDGESVLVHGGASGIGTTAIMFATALGARAFATAGSAKKCAACERFGASAAINYRTSDFVVEIERLTMGRGVNVVLDIVGGDYIARDLECLALDGRVASWPCRLAGASSSISARFLRDGRRFLHRVCVLAPQTRRRRLRANWRNTFGRCCPNAIQSFR